MMRIAMLSLNYAAYTVMDAACKIEKTVVINNIWPEGVAYQLPVKASVKFAGKNF